MQALETIYQGYNFRSRLEARWAVWFDALGISYAYEPEGIQLSTGENYLPDFFLPEFPLWVEIKPMMSGLMNFQHNLINDNSDSIDAAYSARFSKAESLAYGLARDYEIKDEANEGEADIDYPAERVAVVICYGDPGNYLTHTYFNSSGIMNFWHNAYRFVQCCRCSIIYFDGPMTVYGMGTGCACCFADDITPEMRRAVQQARSARFGT